MPSGSEYPLRCYNEPLNGTSVLMCQEVGPPHGGYSDEDFIGTFRGEAARGDGPGSLESAVDRALRSLDTDSAGSCFVLLILR
jgi:hypothetical protein